MGTSDTVDLTLVCTEACKNIQHLLQYFKDKYGQFVQNPPEKLFHQYMPLILDLPDDTTGWKMQPSHALFAAVEKYIWYILADRLYTLPILSGIPDKI